MSSLLNTLSPLGPVKSQYPLTFEEMKQVWCLKATGSGGEGCCVLVTVNLLKRGELLDCCVCNLSCLLCSVLWIRALSDHAAQGPLRAHATYLSAEWGSWPCICVRQWGKPLQWTFVVWPIRFSGQVWEENITGVLVYKMSGCENSNSYFVFFFKKKMFIKSVRLCGQVFQGLLQRDIILVMNITGQQGDTVDILVENMGRVNFGSKINDYKAREQSPIP